MVVTTKQNSTDNTLLVCALNFGILILPLFLAIFVPKIGPLAAVLGSLGGFLCIYGLPTITFISQKYMEVKHPALMEALRKNTTFALHRSMHGDRKSKLAAVDLE